jgi:twitching motility protein PilT
MNYSLDNLLETVVKNNASDLHLTVNAPPSLRIDGKLVTVNVPVLSAQEVENIVLESMSEMNMSIFNEKYELDYVYVSDMNVRFRVNAFKTQNNVEAVFRVVPHVVKSLEELNLPDKLYNISGLMSGLVLFAGASSAGKSTTMSSVIKNVNENYEKRIITIENPIETVYTNMKSVISQREVGVDTKDFPTALRSALRQDPDIIVVGEIRDMETAKIVLEAAQTGHLVLSTIHANDTNDAINRFINLFSDNDRKNVRLMLADNLKTIIAQRLIVDNSLERFPVVEILLNTQRVSEYIKGLEGSSILDIMSKSPDTVGMQSFEKHLFDLVVGGKIDVNVARKAATDEQSLVLLLRKNGMNV